VISCCDHYYIARQLIKLHKKKRDYSLNLPGFMGVTPFFTNSIEFIEKQNTWLSTHIVK